MMRILKETFYTTQVSSRYRREDYVFLVLIIVGGTFLRFWGLGNVGLHGDEETMAMPAMAILDQGGPYLPSGMFYSRALGQIYLMAGSVWLFGESEWAFRLPSTIVGSAMLPVAFILGRRFLTPNFNLLFVAVIATSPAMIEMSQTARMYIFWIAALAIYGVAIFHWERKGTVLSLVLSFIALLIALHFHELSVFAVLLFLFPGLNRRSWSMLILGLLGIGLSVIMYDQVSQWIGLSYPGPGERPPDIAGDSSSEGSTSLALFLRDYSVIALSSLLLGVVLTVWLTLKSLGHTILAVAAASLLAIGVAAFALLHYHVGTLACLFGTILWLRAPQRPLLPLIPIAGFITALALTHLVLLHATGEYPGRQLIGAVVGQPSIWPVLRFADFSPVTFGLYLIVFAFAIVQLGSRRRIPDHFLFFGLAVWIPLTAIGLFKWYVLLRYTSGPLPFFLLCAVAGFAYVIQEWRITMPSILRHRITISLLTGLFVVALANPIALSHVINTSYKQPQMMSAYEVHPDHKGAAEFLLSLPLTADDVVIAEDVLQQTYYLGQVDYWLRNYDDSRGFAVVKNGRILGQYTHAAIIGSGENLLEVLDSYPHRRVFVVGSGEISPGHDEWARGRGIREALQLERLKLVYTGRDGRTMVWLDGG